MKKCPYCAEEIQEEAIKCKHCGEFLEEGKRPQYYTPPALPQQAKDLGPWYFRTSFLVIMLLSIGPLALPLIWWHPTLSKTWKIGITVATILLTAGLWFLTNMAMKSLSQTLETLQNNQY